MCVKSNSIKAIIYSKIKKVLCFALNKWKIGNLKRTKVNITNINFPSYKFVTKCDWNLFIAFLFWSELKDSNGTHSIILDDPSLYAHTHNIVLNIMLTFSWIKIEIKCVLWKYSDFFFFYNSNSFNISLLGASDQCSNWSCELKESLNRNLIGTYILLMNMVLHKPSNFRPLQRT